MGAGMIGRNTWSECGRTDAGVEGRHHSPGLQTDGGLVTEWRIDCDVRHVR